MVNDRDRPDSKMVTQSILNIPEEKVQAMIENIRHHDFMDERSDEMLRTQAIKILMRKMPMEVQKNAPPTKTPYREGG